MKKFFAVISAVVLCVMLLLCGCGADPGRKNKIKLEEVVDFVLEVDAGRDVKVLQLTDIQVIDASQQRREDRIPSWSVDKWQPDKIEERAWNITRQIVERVQPDLIVLSGDNVYGEFDDSGVQVQALVAEMESYGVPWTLTFGNHDNETRKGVEWTCEQYANAEHCFFTRGPIEDIQGNGNFNIGITQGGKLTEVVWLLDSNGHTNSDREQNMYSKEGLFDEQIAWFETRCQKLAEYNGGKSPKSIGFFHHPMRAHGDGMQKYGYVSAKHAFFTEDGDFGTFSVVEIPENDDGDSGCMHVDPASYIDTNYAFHKLLVKYNCEGWFFGHEHQNNSSVTFAGVRYTYGLKASEYDSYVKGELGGTCILLGEAGLRVQHEYYEYPKA